MKFCSRCNEYRHATFTKGGSDLCKNCLYRDNRPLTLCVLCHTEAPYEYHHIIPQSLDLDILAANSTLPICLNCHSVLTYKWTRHLSIQDLLNVKQDEKELIETALKHFTEVFEERRNYNVNTTN